MATHLVVTQPFGDYARGAPITDQTEIDRILDADLGAHVVRVETPDAAPQEPAREAHDAA